MWIKSTTKHVPKFSLSNLSNASFHQCHQPPPPAAAISTSTTCYCPAPPPLPPPDSHHLLQSLISLLQNPKNPPCHCDPHPNLHPPARHPIRRKGQSFVHQRGHDIRESAVLGSLVSRIDAVEAALRRRDACAYGASSVRKAAARVIQSLFRAYLVRRSRSLRHLKDLAFIKTRFSALKSSIVDRAPVDPVAACGRTVDLLYKVDSIQDRDPMIVNGKRSLTRDLIRFLDYIDTISVKTFGALTGGVKKVSVQTRSGSEQVTDLRPERRGAGRNRRVVIETLRSQVEDGDEDSEIVSSSEEEEIAIPNALKKKGFGIGNGGAQVRGKKTVTFADDGSGRSRNVSSIREPVLNQNAGSSTGDQPEMLESLRKRVEEMEAGLASVGAESESGTSDSGATSSAVKTDRKNMHPRKEEEFSFPAPDHLRRDATGVGSILKIKS